MVACSTEKKQLDKIHSIAIAELEKNELEKLHYLKPEELLQLLDEQAAKNESSETTVKGWKVKVNYKTVDEHDKSEKRNTISQILSEAMKRFKHGRS